MTPLARMRASLRRDPAAGWLLAVVVLGITWRVLRFALGFDLWGDEAYVALNIIERSYAQLFAPLDHRQVAPPVYLWLCKACLDLFHALPAMRLPAVLAGIASVPLFGSLAFRILPTRAAWFAWALFAASYIPARYTVELKPYAIDLAVGLLLTTLAVSWVDQFRRARLTNPRRSHLIALASLAGPALWLSFGSAFIASGIALVLLAAAITFHHRMGKLEWAAGAAFAAALAANAAAIYFLCVRPFRQTQTSHFMQQFWAAGFPPRDSLPDFLYWFANVHTGQMFAYPIGEDRFASAGTTAMFLVGLAMLIRRRPWIAAALLTPFLVLFSAAFLRLYPYGGVHPRVTLFLAPAICLACGVGFERLVRHQLTTRWRRRLFQLAGCFLLAVPLMGIGLDCHAAYVAANAGTMGQLASELRAHVAQGGAVWVVNPKQPVVDDGTWAQFAVYLHHHLPNDIRWGEMPTKTPTTNDYVLVLWDDQHPGRRAWQTSVQHTLATWGPFQKSIVLPADASRSRPTVQIWHDADEDVMPRN